jgi:hypothetical protein
MQRHDEPVAFHIGTVHRLAKRTSIAVRHAAVAVPIEHPGGVTHRQLRIGRGSGFCPLPS